MSDRDTEDLAPRGSSTVGSGDLRIKKSTIKLLAAVIIFFGGPGAVWGVYVKIDEKADLLAAHDTQIKAIMAGRAEDRPKIANINRLTCLICFDRYGAQAKRCGEPCEPHRPWISEDD